MKEILVIEGDEQMRENIAEILEMSGYVVEMAVDGLEGLQKVFSLLPDLVICKIALPGISGYDILEAMKMSPGLREIPFIFLTPNNDDGQNIIRGIALGADNYLSIPFDYAHLIDAVKKHLGQKRRKFKNAS